MIELNKQVSIRQPQSDDGMQGPPYAATWADSEAVG